MKIIYILCLGLFFHFNELKPIKVDSLKIVNDELKDILNNTFGVSRKGMVILIRVNNNNNEYELKIMKDDTIFLRGLLKNVYGYNDLVGFFEYGEIQGIVYGERRNIFFKKIGKMNIPDYYLEVIEGLKKPPVPIDPDIPPTRYDSSVFYYKYKNGKLVFDRSEWANIWGDTYKEYIRE